MTIRLVAYLSFNTFLEYTSEGCGPFRDHRYTLLLEQNINSMSCVYEGKDLLLQVGQLVGPYLSCCKSHFEHLFFLSVGQLPLQPTRTETSGVKWSRENNGSYDTHTHARMHTQTHSLTHTHTHTHMLYKQSSKLIALLR